MADSFNKYFSTVARKLVEKLPGQTSQYGESHVHEFYSQLGVQAGSFFFEKVSQAFVLEKLRRLDGSKATGLDSIPSRFVRDATEIITPSITQQVNRTMILSQ